MSRLNVCSATQKSALIYDVIADFNLDFLSLSETRITANTPDTIELDSAPD
jgi:hypothetical protein